MEESGKIRGSGGRCRVAVLLLAMGWLAGNDAGASDDPARARGGVCTYETYRWNADHMKAVGRTRVVKSFADLTAGEVDPATGCSVCAEDQVEIHLDGVAPFRVCRHLAATVSATLGRLQAQGVPIESVEGYRVGMTRGGTDDAGNRTRFSNHSFGIALDINAAANGLYESCREMGAGCRLRKGGPWDPVGNALSMRADHPIVLAMKEIGFRWGGQLDGRQKDFMHFSPTGD